MQDFRKLNVWQKALIAVATVLVLFSATFAQKPKPRPAGSKPKAAVTPQKKLNEQAEWDKATALTGAAERIAAFKKFIKAFPKSLKLTEAATHLVAAEAALGAEKLVAADIPAGAALFKAAAIDAPKPVPDQLWNDLLSKFAANLYFRGARSEALEITKILEDKAETNVSQLLNIATFYLSTENGTEAKRVAEAAIKLEPGSSAAYQTLGLAHRMDFQLEDSASAFAKALELEPESVTARRGLAEMKRSLGKADEAVALYREMLAKDETNVPARTGLVLSLFDAGARANAEAEMSKTLEENPGNVILLAGAAYWYAAHNEGDKAVEFANKAIAADARFIWSHIALARGFLAQNKPVEAEKTLLAARRYGNFPTLEYEIASARLGAGLYREAAEELARSFSVKDGTIQANLGGRVARESKYFTELVGFERRASIFAPTAADTPESAAQLRALLELKQALDAAEPKADAAAQAADEFVRGDDKMKVHRQLFAAAQMLEKKTALQKVLEIVKAAPQSLDAGLDVPDVSTAVLASELYETRKIAAAREDYVAVATVPRTTLSSVLRGRIEEIIGWTLYQMDDAAQATVHLRRAVGVLPPDSAYWRSSLWRLGTALLVKGNDADALDAYIKSYKSSPPDAVRYNAIESVYKRVNGSLDGLEEKIGPNPAPSAALVAQKPDLPPTRDIPAVVPAAIPGPPVEQAPQPTPDLPAIVPAALPSPAAEQRAEPTPASIEQTPKLEVPVVPMATPEEPRPSPDPTPEEKPAATPEASPTPTPEPTPSPETTPTPAAVLANDEAKPVDIPSVVPISSLTPALEVPGPIPTVEEAKPTPTPDPSPTLTPTPEPESPAEKTVAQATPESRPKELFPPIVITIPPPETPNPARKPTPAPEAAATDTRLPSDDRPRITESKPKRTAPVKPCRLTVSEPSVTLQTGGDLAVIVGRSDDNELDGLTAVSTSPDNVSVRRQVIEGMRTRALFVLHAAATRPGVYQVMFEMPCGKREIVVRVK